MIHGELVLPEEDQLAFARTLVQRNLFGVKESRSDYITLKSGRLSPHYLDIRPGIADYGIRKKVADTMANLGVAKTQLPNLGADFIVGSPEAMTSYAASIADKLEMGLLQPRVALNKASGNKTPILGWHYPEDKVAAFDDVVTDGDTKIDTITTLRKAGLDVLDYYVVLDREEGGAPQVAEATGIEITPALGVSSMVRMLYAEKVFNQTQYDNVARYLSEYGDPHAQELMNTAL
jgi:orotate phosphoribosyltransferase